MVKPYFKTPVYYALAIICLSLLCPQYAECNIKPNSFFTAFINPDTARSEGGKLLVYVGEGDSERTKALHLAYNSNGNFTPLNNGKAILYPLIGSRKMGAPHLFNKDTGFGLITSDNQNGHGVFIYDSEDLIDFKNERLVILSDSIKVKNPICEFDSKLRSYRISWSGSDGKFYESMTQDLKTISQTREIGSYSRSLANIDTPRGAVQGSILNLDGEAFKRILRKYGTIVHTGFAPIEEISVAKGKRFSVDLPEMVTAQYSDGSTKKHPVRWSEKELRQLNTSKRGTYEITGTVKLHQFENPFIEQRADPHVVKGSDGYYYFTASYPMIGSDDPTGYDRVILRKAERIEDLANAEEITIWHVDKSAISERWVWAPEIHEINGTWYVLFTTSRPEWGVWGIRPIIIACNKGDRDPMKAENWETEGHYSEAVEGDEMAFKHFSLDMTYFESNGTHYVSWAEKPMLSNIMIASIDPDQPWKLTSKATLLSVPQYGWERKDNTWVNEGSAVIKNGGKVFLAFSASTVDEAYSIGILHADADADLLDVDSWAKIPYPLLSSDDLDGQVGPGHNSFTIDEMDQPLIVYHSRTEGEVSGPGDKGDGGLFDPGRHARIRPVHFDKDGIPVLNMKKEQLLDPSMEKVTIKITIK
ncbi:family 43 glycosylhydrolase [Anditalea andensis]|uniref:Bacterial Ig-like domain-containing protein n=1 Tax=Anditalea andensis TaxID=1048983 RepID=A0A074LK20_9BACT|nr:family 43 glycosylhydrolase [Anditalea andensis]KEO74132.1 hypothetical protein EL17_08305 [Anditalea andensis]